MIRRTLTTHVVLLAAILTLGGCTSDVITDPDPNTGPLILPPSPDRLMGDFEQAYTEMDLSTYSALLDEDFDYKFLDGERDALPWSRELEIMSTENMFNGNPGALDDAQVFCSGVESISIGEFIQSSSWEETGPDDPDFPDAKRAIFQIDIVFYADGGDNTISINSGQIFYVRGEAIEQDDGSTVTRYSLCGQRDMRPAKGNERLYWGDIKRMFLPEANRAI